MLGPPRSSKIEVTCSFFFLQCAPNGQLPNERESDSRRRRSSRPSLGNGRPLDRRCFHLSYRICCQPHDYGESFITSRLGDGDKPGAPSPSAEQPADLPRSSTRRTWLYRTPSLSLWTRTFVQAFARPSKLICRFSSFFCQFQFTFRCSFELN